MSIRILISIVFLVGLNPALAFAERLPDTTIQHEAGADFGAGTRVALDAKLYDSKGIIEVRCYFKTGLDEKYLYVAMNQQSGNMYRCSLPAFEKGVQTLEYFFLIVNRSRQVIRSTPYAIGEDSGKTGQEQTAAGLPILYVYSELGDLAKDDTAIADDRVEVAATQDVNQLYGLRSGLYEFAALPGYENAVPGYFGGFIVEKGNNRIRPVEGIAPNLKPSFSGFKSPVNADQTSSDMEIEIQVAPDIAGTDWLGYFDKAHTIVRQNLIATVVQDGSAVSIETSLSGMGHLFIGEMNSGGDMLLYDEYDGEDWTTHFGPATEILIKIYDYVLFPDGWELNEIVLYRIPKPPMGVQTGDGACEENRISVSWDASEYASSYSVYTCHGDLVDDCIFLSRVNTTHYDALHMNPGPIQYRVRACNSNGCGEFSKAVTGYCPIVMPPILHLLL